MSLKDNFPMLQNDIVYLDSGALVQKPKTVINAINDFYTKYCISNRTSDSELGILTNSKIEDTRKKCANLINANPDEIIFNSGTTEGLNYAALLLEKLVNENDEILVSKYNHSSHMIPWIELAKKRKAKIVFVENFLDSINSKTKIVAFTQVTNNFNKQEDIELVYKKAKEVGAYLINDVAQAISHEKVNSQYCDILAFSANKLFGPTGLGILYVNQNVLNKVESKKYGGGTIDYVKENGEYKNKNSIAKHEAGTLNLAGIYGFYESLVFVENLDFKLEQKKLKDLSIYACKQLNQIENLKVVSNPGDPIILFSIKNVSSQDIASYLGHKNIYVRSGYFCAQYLSNIIEDSLVRISLHFYNDKNDIDKLVDALKNGGDFIDFI